MPDDPRSDRMTAEPDLLSPADAAVTSRLREFAEIAVRPFDVAAIVELATVTPQGHARRLGGSPAFRAWSTRSIWALAGVGVAIALATIAVVVGSQLARPRFVQVPPSPSITVPSQRAVAPSSSASPSASPLAPEPAALGPGRITYTKDGDVYVAKMDGSDARKILSGGAQAYDDPRWSGDGRISVTRDASGAQDHDLDIELTDATGARPRKVGQATSGQGGTYQLWSPDGTRLAILDRTAITIIGGGKPTTLLPPSGDRWDVSDVVTFSWSPDGTRLLAGVCVPQGDSCDKGAATRLMLVPVDGRPPRELPPGWMATFSPDGSKIAFVASETAGFQLSVMDADGTNRRVLVPPVANGSWTYDLTYAWSPDGRSIAFHHSVDDGNGVDLMGGKGLWVKDVDSDAPPRAITLDAGIFGVHAWSPDGRWVLVSGFENDVSHLAAIDVLTGAEQILAEGTQDGDWIWGPSPDVSATPSPAPSASPSPPTPPGSPAGLVYLHGHDVMAAGLDGSDPRTLATDARPPSDADAVPDFDPLALSPDGMTVAYVGPDGVDLVSSSGRHVDSISGGATARGDRIAMAWASDSQRLAVYRDSEPDRISIIRTDGHELAAAPLPSDFVAGSLSTPSFSWSPDGRWFAISGCSDLCQSGPGHQEMDEILLVAADGSGSHWLNDRTVSLDPLPVGGEDAWADWSIDSRLAVSRDCQPGDIWCSESDYPALQITGPDGVGGRQVHADRGLGRVAWSPDGRRIAIASWTPGGPSLVIAEPDGSFTSVGGVGGVHGPGNVGWAPDGASILISGGGSLWSVPLDGGPARELVTGVDEWFAVGPG